MGAAMGSRHILRAALIGALTLGAGGAFAQTKIGGAAVVKNDVRGQLQSGTSRIAQGDGVFQDEDVRTATDSLAKLVLLDDTNVSVGPSSRIKLDKFVYNSNAGAPQVTMNATKGVFRFISGVSPHDAYSIQTPEASIGVRGTTYDVRVLGGETMVTLQDGVVHVCVRGTQRCVDLDTPGQSVRVTRSGIDGPIPPERKTWDFGSLCAGLCAPTQFASLPPAIERPPVKATRAAPRLRVRHAAATPSPPPQPRVVHKTRTVERHIPRKPRRIGRASRDDDDDDVVYGGPPAVYLPPPGFGYGPYGGYRGGYGGGYGGGGYRGGGYGGGGYGGRGGGGGRGAR